MKINRYKLIDIAILNAQNINKSDKFTEIEYLDTSSIQEGCISDIQILDRKSAPSRAKRKVKNDTIVYSTVRPNLRHYGIIKNPPQNFIVSTGFTTIDLKDEYKEKIFPDYLYLLLSQECITNYLHGIAQNSVSSYPSINPSDISNLSFLFPEFTVQQHIAKILTDIDSKIAVNKKIIKELETMSKELYDYWFVQFDFPGIDGKPYKSSGGKIAFNPILKREIPEGWEIKSINDFCTSYRGVSYDKSDLLDGPEGGVLVLRGNNIDGNTLVYDDNVAYVPPSFVEPEQKIKKNDIIMTMSSGSKEHVGKCTMFQANSEHTYGAFMTKFTPNPECPFFAYRSMLSDFFKAKIKYICGGTGINNLTNQTFDEILFPFPPKDVLKEFEKLLTPIYEKVGKNNDEILRLTALRDELLPMLMNGQVRVK